MHIDLILKINASPDMSYNILWDTFKAYIRGNIISYIASDRKGKLEHVSEISDKTQNLWMASGRKELFYRQNMTLSWEGLSNDKHNDI